MSRNNKNARKLALAREFSKMHLRGQKGPKSTQKKHNKKNVWYKDRMSHYRRNEKGFGKASKSEG